MTTIIKIDDKLHARVTATKENENVVITVGPAAHADTPGQITVSYFIGGVGWSQIYGRTWSSIYDQIRDLRHYPALVKMLHKGLELTMDELQSKVKQERLRDPKPSAPPEEIDRPDTTGDVHVRLISDTGNVVDRAFPSWTSLIGWMDQHYRSPHTVHIMHDGERLSFDRVLARAQKERPVPPRGLYNRLRAWWSK